MKKIPYLITIFWFMAYGSQEPIYKSASQKCAHLDAYIPTSGLQHIILGYLTWEQAQILEGHDDCVNSISFSPNGEYLASGSGDGTIKIWSLYKGTFKFLLTPEKQDRIYLVAFSPDNNYFVSTSGWERAIKLWQRKKERFSLLHTHKVSCHIRSLAFSPDGKYLIYGSDQLLSKLQIENNQLRFLRGREGNVSSLAFSPDSKCIACGQENKLIIRSVGSLKRLQTIQAHENGIYSVVFSPDQKYVASGSGDKTITIWEKSNDQYVLHQTLKDHAGSVTSVSFLSDSKHLVSGSSDGTIKIWQLNNNLFASIQTLLVQGSNNQTHFSPDGMYLACCSSDKNIKIWKNQATELMLTSQLEEREEPSHDQNNSQACVIL